MPPRCDSGESSSVLGIAETPASNLRCAPVFSTPRRCAPQGSYCPRRHRFAQPAQLPIQAPSGACLGALPGSPATPDDRASTQRRKRRCIHKQTSQRITAASAGGDLSHQLPLTHKADSSRCWEGQKLGRRPSRGMKRETIPCRRQTHTLELSKGVRLEGYGYTSRQQAPQRPSRHLYRSRIHLGKPLPTD